MTGTNGREVDVQSVSSGPPSAVRPPCPSGDPEADVPDVGYGSDADTRNPSIVAGALAERRSEGDMRLSRPLVV